MTRIVKLLCNLVVLAALLSVVNADGSVYGLRFGSQKVYSIVKATMQTGKNVTIVPVSPLNQLPTGWTYSASFCSVTSKGPIGVVSGTEPGVTQVYDLNTGNYLGVFKDWFGAVSYDYNMEKFVGAKLVWQNGQAIASQVGYINTAGEYAPTMTMMNVTFSWGFGFAYSSKKQVFFSTLQDVFFKYKLGIWDLNMQNLTVLPLSDSCFIWQYSDSLDTLYCFSAIGQLINIDLETGNLQIISTPVSGFNLLLGSALDDTKSTMYVTALRMSSGEIVVVEISLPSGNVVGTYVTPLAVGDFMLANGIASN